MRTREDSKHLRGGATVQEQTPHLKNVHHFAHAVDAFERVHAKPVDLNFAKALLPGAPPILQHRRFIAASLTSC